MASTLTNSEVNGGVAVTLGKVSGATTSLSENFSITPKVTDGSDACILASIGGGLRTIKVKGVLTAESFALLNTAKNAIEEFVSGNQVTLTTLSLDAEGTILFSGQGVIQDFTWKYGVDTRAIIDYNLSFVEGAL